MPSPLSTRSFLDRLAARPDAPLHFDAAGTPVEPGYHLTEVKATTVRAMDCGGGRSDWAETILQLWPPAGAEAREAMLAGKFLSIVERVQGQVPLDDEALVRVEYGPLGEDARAFVAESIVDDADGLRVHLAAPVVACKAQDRSVGFVPLRRADGDGCCTPAAAAANTDTRSGCCGTEAA